jgi:hypothetical protein
MIRATPIEEEEADHLSTPSKPPKAKPQGRRGKIRRNRSLASNENGVQQRKIILIFLRKPVTEVIHLSNEKHQFLLYYSTRNPLLLIRSDSTTLTAEKANNDSVPITESLKVTGHPLQNYKRQH